jgi:hypothetical protein
MVSVSGPTDIGPFSIGDDKCTTRQTARNARFAMAQVYVQTEANVTAAVALDE